LATRRTIIAGLLKRFQFIDLARVVALPPSTRKDWLRKYVDRPGGKFATYEPFRKCTGGIYGVAPGLDPTPPLDWQGIEEAIVRACDGENEDMNLSAAKALHEVLGYRSFRAYPHPERSLRLGPDRTVAFRLDRLLVRDDRAVFQFPYPRRSSLQPEEVRLMLSLIHYSYVFGDVADAAVELADLSCPPRAKDREPRIISLDRSDLIDRDELGGRIQEVYAILMELSVEP
jgi:hypothetical protein